MLVGDAELAVARMCTFETVGLQGVECLRSVKQGDDVCTGDPRSSREPVCTAVGVGEQGAQCCRIQPYGGVNLLKCAGRA
jgi:hypothetical protein